MKKIFFLLPALFISLFIGCNSDAKETPDFFIKIADKQYYEKSETIQKIVSAQHIAVQKGDNLWDLAGACIGAPYEWETIFQMNLPFLSDRLEFKELNGEMLPWVWIYPGEKLFAPQSFQFCDERVIQILKEDTLISYFETKDALFLKSDSLPADTAGWKAVKVINQVPTPKPVKPDLSETGIWSTIGGWFMNALAFIWYIIKFVFCGFLIILAVLMALPLAVLLTLLIYKFWRWFIDVLRSLFSSDSSENGGAPAPIPAGPADDNEHLSLQLLRQLQETGGKINLQTDSDNIEISIPKQKGGKKK